jgi:hypothetical protein
VPLQQPVRYLDTRTGNGFRLGPLGPAGTYAVPVAGIGAVPYDAVSIVGNLTGTAPTARAFLSVFPAGLPWPGTSSLNLTTPDRTVNPGGRHRRTPDGVQSAAGAIALRASCSGMGS